MILNIKLVLRCMGACRAHSLHIRRPAQLMDLLPLVRSGVPTFVATAGAAPLHTLLPATLASLTVPPETRSGAAALPAFLCHKRCLPIISSMCPNVEYCT